MIRTGRFSGFKGFLLVWFGQLVSLVGSAMTRFAMTIWAYQETESALVLATVGIFSFGPALVFGPIAGAMVDRWNRKVVMIVSDIGSSTATVILFGLFMTGNLQIWHLYLAGAIASVFDSFQFPAFSAAVTMMVPKKHYGRASGLQSFSESTSTIAAPMLAGVMLALFGIEGVMLFDIVTFLFAVTTLLFVIIPQPKTTETDDMARGGLLKEALYGFKYIWQRPSLLGMQMMFFLINFFGGAAFVLLPPMVLASTGSNELALGTVQAALGAGGVVGSVVMGIWGGPRRRVHGVFIGMALSGLVGQVIIGLGRGVPVWALGAFLFMFFIPILNASNQAIWQSKVAPQVQGRVFTVRRLIAQITTPFAMFASGFLADYIFEPGMMPGGALVPVFGGVLGTGPGTGMALIFIISGVLAGFSGLLGYAIPFIRDIETILPDHEAVGDTAQEAAHPIAGDDRLPDADAPLPVASS